MQNRERNLQLWKAKSAKKLPTVFHQWWFQVLHEEDTLQLSSSLVPLPHISGLLWELAWAAGGFSRRWGILCGLFPSGDTRGLQQNHKASGVTLRCGVEWRRGIIDSPPPVITASCHLSLHHSTMSKGRASFVEMWGGGGNKEAVKEIVEGKLDGWMGGLRTFQGE